MEPQATGQPSSRVRAHLSRMRSQSHTSRGRISAGTPTHSKYAKGGGNHVAHLTQVEFNTIRELLGPATVGLKKMRMFAQSAHSSDVKTFFENAEKDCQNKVNQLMGLLRQ